MSVYFAPDYRTVIHARIKENEKYRGYKSRLAEAAGCHSSYLSQVLNGRVELTLEQAMNLAVFWNLKEGETRHFLNLLQRDRAGSTKLRAFYEKSIRKVSSGQEAFRNIAADERLSLAQANVYYSNWYIGAIHLLVLMKETAHPKSIAARLGIPLEVVRDTILLLEEMGRIKRKGSHWEENAQSHFLPRKSIFNGGYQSQWRMRAAASLHRRDPEAFHSTLLATVSRDKISHFKARLAALLEELRASANESEGEEGMALLMDFFPV